MKQENRFVTQLFHYLAPFVDMERDLFICVDGGAAKHHAGTEGARLLDPNVPDLWFAFCGQQTYTGIEAKVLEKNSISIRQGQLQAWRTNGPGAYKPRFWVATNRELKDFFCWHHSVLLPRLDSSSSTVDNVSLSLSEYPPAHTSRSIAELALFILTHHKADA
ncbi:MAG: hypothetical protein HY208_03080 [Nitrospirae bacterium]|nr:hypothetical protein [Nitrospirota bacterium]